MLKRLRACKAFPPAAWERGRQATARVRGAWERETLGDFKGLYTARHIEPHEMRVLVASFGVVNKSSAKHGGEDGGKRRQNAMKNQYFAGEVEADSSVHRREREERSHGPACPSVKTRVLDSTRNKLEDSKSREASLSLQKEAKCAMCRCYLPGSLTTS